MKIQLIRHATMIIDIKGKRILIDPMLSDAGTLAAVPGVANNSNNPLVNLSVDPLALTNVDAIMVTHTHLDHFDDAATALLPHSCLLFGQPADEARILKAGFTNLQVIDESYKWNGITITRTAGQHGTGRIGEKMGPVSGFVLESPGEPVLYIAGDTIWCQEVQDALEKYHPQVIVCFAGSAKFSSGDPITMTKEDILSVSKTSPTSKIIAVHLEAWNHCGLTRRELLEYSEDNSLTEQVYIPHDGEWMTF